MTKMTRMMRVVGTAGGGIVWGDNANKCDALNKSSADRRVMMMTIMTIAITNQILVKKFIKQPDNEKKNEFLLNGDINELPKFDKIFHLQNFLLH